MRYTISKGNHYADGIHLGLHFGATSVKKTVWFDSSCYYNLGGPDQLDINKLYGFSEGFHHCNSARFGWRCDVDAGMIQLHGYVYRDGKRVNEWDTNTLIQTVKFERMIETQIEIKHDYYLFKVKDGNFSTVKAIARGRHCFPVGYELFPYFGGNMCAPHDMSIELF